MTEKITPTTDNKYQHRLQSAMLVAGYDALSNNQKALIAQLAYDKELSVLDFNEALNAELRTHGHDSDAHTKVGSPVLARVVERPAPSIEEHPSLIPRTFEEAKQRSGHSVEDVVQTMPDIDQENIRGAFDSVGELSESDGKFYNNEFLDKHLKSIAKITDRFLRRFPEKYRKEADEDTVGAYHLQPLFLQHDSPAYLKAKLVEGKEDKPTVRFYLNPELSDTSSVYADFLNKALASNLRFKSKIIRPVDMPMYRAYKSEYLDKGVGKLDPIVIYGYEESKDDLLKIIAEIYETHSVSFQGRKIGGSPLEVADGIGVGDEVKDSGNTSLTSSRMDVARVVLDELKNKNSNWDDASPAARKRAFANSLRRQYESLGYNPDNIAFNASLGGSGGNAGRHR